MASEGAEQGPPNTFGAPELVSEFVGTFLLVFTVGCNVLSKNAWGGVSIGCVLMVAIYALGGISGGNFNPAVSLALSVAKKQGWKKTGAYCGVQLLAGIVAGGCYSLVFFDTFNLQPGKGFSWWQAGLAELLYTFMLCFVVLNVACSDKDGKGKARDKNQYYGLAIGFVIVAGAYSGGPVSGGCFNPAVAFGIDISSARRGFGYSLDYAVFELAGAALAAIVYQVCRPKESDKNAVAADEVTPVQYMVSEFLGTFFLVLTVTLNVLGGFKGAAFSIAASLMCMIYALGDVSGANFNPAVSLAIFCSGLGDFDGKKLGLYMASQIVGGMCASFTTALLYAGASFGLGPKGTHGWVDVGIVEFLFTFVLCFVVLSVAVAQGKTNSSQMFGLAIGSCVTVGGFAAGGISGGSLNPAVSFGIAGSHILGGGFFYKCIIYSIFEFLGGVAAAGLLRVTHKDDPGTFSPKDIAKPLTA